MLSRVEKGIEQQVQLLALRKSPQIDRLSVEAVSNKAAFNFRLCLRVGLPCDDVLLDVLQREWAIVLLNSREINSF